jgi:hypothetical protein
MAFLLIRCPQIKKTPAIDAQEDAKKQPQAEILEHDNRPPFSPYQPHRTGLKADIIIFFLSRPVKLITPISHNMKQPQPWNGEETAAACKSDEKEN